MAVKATVVLGVLSLLVAIVAVIVPVVVPDPVRESDLVIDDLELIDATKEVGATVVDLKVRNRGDRVAFIRQAQFEVKKAYSIDFCLSPSRVESSYTYDVKLPTRPKPEGTTISHGVSQRVAGNDVDRFRFRLGTTGEAIGQIVYYVRLRLVSNGGEATESPWFVASVPRPSRAQAASSPPDGLGDPTFRRCWERNATAMEAISAIRGPRSPTTRGYLRTSREIRESIRSFDANAQRERSRWQREFSSLGVPTRQVRLDGRPTVLVADGGDIWVGTQTGKIQRVNVGRGAIVGSVSLSWPKPVAVMGGALWVQSTAPDGRERSYRVDRRSLVVRRSKMPALLRRQPAARDGNVWIGTTLRRLRKYSASGAVVASRLLPSTSSYLDYHAVDVNTNAVWVGAVEKRAVLRYHRHSMRLVRRIRLDFDPQQVVAGTRFLWITGNRMEPSGRNGFRYQPVSRLYRTDSRGQNLIRSSKDGECCVVYRDGIAWTIRSYLTGTEIRGTALDGREIKRMLVAVSKPSRAIATAEGLALAGESGLGLVPLP